MRSFKLEKILFFILQLLFQVLSFAILSKSLFVEPTSYFNKVVYKYKKLEFQTNLVLALALSLKLDSHFFIKFLSITFTSNLKYANFEIFYKPS